MSMIFRQGVPAQNVSNEAVARHSFEDGEATAAPAAGISGEAEEVQDQIEDSAGAVEDAQDAASSNESKGKKKAKGKGKKGFEDDEACASNEAEGQDGDAVVVEQTAEESETAYNPDTQEDSTEVSAESKGGKAKKKGKIKPKGKKGFEDGEDPEAEAPMDDDVVAEDDAAETAEDEAADTIEEKAEEISDAAEEIADVADDVQQDGADDVGAEVSTTDTSDPEEGVPVSAESFIGHGLASATSGDIASFESLGEGNIDDFLGTNEEV